MTFRYCRIDWTPTVNADSSITLKSPTSTRELLVKSDGVYECKLVGDVMLPVTKIDGGPVMSQLTTHLNSGA